MNVVAEHRWSVIIPVFLLVCHVSISRSQASTDAPTSEMLTDMSTNTTMVTGDYSDETTSPASTSTLTVKTTATATTISGLSQQERQTLILQTVLPLAVVVLLLVVVIICLIGKMRRMKNTGIIKTHL